MRPSVRRNVRFLTSVRAASDHAPDVVLDHILHRPRAFPNVPTSQQYHYRTESTRPSLALRLGGAQLMVPTRRAIYNTDASHPIFFSRLSPREAGLCLPLVTALRRMKIFSLTALQGALVPSVLKGRHVLAHAETGSGKSFGVALALANRIARQAINYRLHTIVLVPTEELAFQYEKWLMFFAGSASQVVQAAVKSTPLERQLTRLHNIQPHVLVGTVQRVAEIAEACPQIIGEKLRRRVDCIVLDEADAILNAEITLKGMELKGHHLIERLYRNMQHEIPAQIVAISATIDGPTAQRLNGWMCNDTAVRLTTSTVECVVPPTIAIYLMSVRASMEESIRTVLQLIRRHDGETAKVLVFAPDDHQRLCDGINADWGRNVAGILYDRPVEKSAPRFVGRRKEILCDNHSNVSKINSGELRVGVAPPEVSRGLHLSGITHVVLVAQADMSASTFVHCVGRTGRLQCEGEAFVLFAPPQGRAVQEICEALCIPFQVTRWSRVLSALALDVETPAANFPEDDEDVRGGEEENTAPHLEHLNAETMFYS